MYVFSVIKHVAAVRTFPSPSLIVNILFILLNIGHYNIELPRIYSLAKA